MHGLPLIPAKGGAHLRRALTTAPSDQIEVVIDIDARTGLNQACPSALETVLSSRLVHVSSYPDAGVPADVRWHQEGPDLAPVDWLQVKAIPVEGSTRRPRTTHLIRSSPGGQGVTTWPLYAHPEEWTPAAHDGDAEAAKEWLAGRVAQTVGAALFITDKATLTSENGTRSMGSTLCATPERATAILGMIQRFHNDCLVRPHMGVTRWSFMWLALDDLLPNYPLWAARCSHDNITGSGQISYYARGFEWRMFQALMARDQLAHSASQEQADQMSEVDACDRVVISLLACFDATAHVAHAVCQGGLPDAEVKWQRKRLRETLQEPAPELAALFAPQTRAQDVLTVLSTLRNSIHGGGFDTRHLRYTGEDSPEQRLSIPADDLNRFRQAVTRTGGQEQWGLHLDEKRAYFDSATLIPRLFDEALHLLNRVLALTPVDRIELADPPAEESDGEGAEDADDEVVDAVPDNTAGNVIEQILGTRGSGGYAYQLGLGHLYDSSR